jgi:hypothetical protein
MAKQFEVRWEGDLAGTPAEVWDAFTVHTAGWYWQIRYEPWVGGAETGLTQHGGVVTAWEPATHFTTRLDGEGGFFNQLDYRLEPNGTGTHLTFTHQGAFAEERYDQDLDMCQQHTRLYYHSLGEYLRHFPGRDAAYVAMDAPGSFTSLRESLGIPPTATAGDEVTLEPVGVEGVVDYATGPFLGVRTTDALYRFFGRDTWGLPVGVAMHLFATDTEPTVATWRRFLQG